MRTGVRFVGTEANFYAVTIALKFFILTATCPRLKMDFPSELENNNLIQIIIYFMLYLNNFLVVSSTVISVVGKKLLTKLAKIWQFVDLFSSQSCRTASLMPFNSSLDYQKLTNSSKIKSENLFIFRIFGKSSIVLK